MTLSTPGRQEHLTFKANLRNTRYGWLRLTPAYSVHLVSELIDSAGIATRVLDPFCGTGTTALVCAERGIQCDTTDINPFLIWLTDAKTCVYDQADVDIFGITANLVLAAIARNGASEWLPPIHQIEKWWGEETVHALGHAATEIRALEATHSMKVINLLKVAFCQTMIERANVSFGHQSMSFKKQTPQNARLPLQFREQDLVAENWARSTQAVGNAARSTIMKKPGVSLQDARSLSASLPQNTYELVVTSPPYPNRMSYIRELRPYMYWLGFLSDARQAGELDWTAIGGTWGCATSNLAKWVPTAGRVVPFEGFTEILDSIRHTSDLLSTYVQKYFEDMVVHSGELYKVVAPGGRLHYIVGNSKFYDVLLPVENIYAAMFREVGFQDVTVKVIRKRSSKKELFEYIVSARKPQ